ncbi:recombinase family protein [Dermacoccus nishinomiyaensis]|uniref:recombinase family protein n=1 Tax=Dermacoccus nishinomiyaensis TaxID=1274 RepID=UPI00093DEE49|nr:recombinase family protein [Dermacoccus nishinomiyaensis]
MRIGYIRRSTREQPTTLTTQREALEADGCERIFEDTISGAKSRRPGLDAALDYLRPGDRLVVTRLDRLGRTRVDTLNTMDELRQRGIIVECHHPRLDTSDPAGRLVMAVLADLAEWERDVLIERTREGLAQARKMGKTGGRPASLDAQQRANVVTMREAGMTRAEVAKTFDVHPSTIRRVENAFKGTA